MTLKEYVDNPSGKGDSSMNRAVVTNVLTNKYETLVKDKTIRVNVYKTIGLNPEYFIHLVIPTETTRTNTYDVVYHLFNPDKKDTKKKLRDYEVKFFSNTPSFAYTFLNVYYKNGLFEESLAEKFDKIFFTKEPVERNQYGIVNYEKYLYFGAKFILDSLLLTTKAALDLRAINYTKIVFNGKIRTFDTIMNQYKRAEHKLKSNTRNVRLESERKEREINSDGKVQVKKPKPVKSKEVKIKKPTKPSVKNIKKK